MRVRLRIRAHEKRCYKLIAAQKGLIFSQITEHIKESKCKLRWKNITLTSVSLGFFHEPLTITDWPQLPWLYGRHLLDEDSPLRDNDRYLLDEDSPLYHDDSLLHGNDSHINDNDSPLRDDDSHFYSHFYTAITTTAPTQTHTLRTQPPPVQSPPLQMRPPPQRPLPQTHRRVFEKCCLLDFKRL